MQQFIVALLSLLTVTNAFLFPDLKQRSGRGQQFGVAAIEEEPYLYPNGSGYIPELLAEISRSSGFAHGDRPLPLDVVPVKTWKQLLAKVNSGRVSVGFGLQLHSMPSSHFFRSIPTLRTSPKLLVKSSAVSLYGDQHSTTGNPVLVMRDGPLQKLFTGPLSYQAGIHMLDQSAEIVELLSSSSLATVALSNAANTDYLSTKSNSELTSTCAKSSIPGTQFMYFSFFGNDREIIDRINLHLLSMVSSGKLQSLNSKYFSKVEHC